jgi:hypothetical protein
MGSLLIDDKNLPESLTTFAKSGVVVSKSLILLALSSSVFRQGAKRFELSGGLKILHYFPKDETLPE